MAAADGEDTEYRSGVCPPGGQGQRIDRVLAGMFPDLSRTRIKALIEGGALLMDGAPCLSPATPVAAGARFELRVPAPVPTGMPAEPMDLEVVYEDAHVIVINKPAGLVVHPGAGVASGTLANGLLAHCHGSLSGIGGVERPGIVHRLDKDTSGLIVAAKTDFAHKALSAQLSDRTMHRTYIALVLGKVMPPSGVVDAPIGRHRTNRLKMAVHGSGKPAKTRYEVLQRCKRGDFTAVQCDLESGRTHQIRVHMAHIGYLLIGDPLYGPQATKLASALKKAGFSEESQSVVRSFSRQALHAARLAFIHPETGESLCFEVPPPADFEQIIGIFF